MNTNKHEWPQKAQKHKKSGTISINQGMRALCDQIRQTAFNLYKKFVL